MDKQIEELSDAELLAVIRRAENTNIPGSQFQKAQNEWQIRSQQKLIDATQNKKSGVFFEVGGNMANHGVIQADKNTIIDIAVAGDYSGNKNTKVIQGDVHKEKEWYEKPFGIILLAVFAGVMVTYLTFRFGWK